MHACSVTQSCLALCNPMDFCWPGTSVRGIFQARILERVAISHSRGLSQPGVKLASSGFLALAGGIFTTEPPRYGPEGKALV